MSVTNDKVTRVKALLKNFQEQLASILAPSDLGDLLPQTEKTTQIITKSTQVDSRLEELVNLSGKMADIVNTGEDSMELEEEGSTTDEPGVGRGLRPGPVMVCGPPGTEPVKGHSQTRFDKKESLVYSRVSVDISIVPGYIHKSGSLKSIPPKDTPVIAKTFAKPWSKKRELRSRTSARYTYSSDSSSRSSCSSPVSARTRAKLKNKSGGQKSHLYSSAAASSSVKPREQKMRKQENTEIVNSSNISEDEAMEVDVKPRKKVKKNRVIQARTGRRTDSDYSAEDITPQKANRNRSAKANGEHSKPDLIVSASDIDSNVIAANIDIFTSDDQEMASDKKAEPKSNVTRDLEVRDTSMRRKLSDSSLLSVYSNMPKLVDDLQETFNKEASPSNDKKDRKTTNQQARKHLRSTSNEHSIDRGSSTEPVHDREGNIRVKLRKKPMVVVSKLNLEDIHEKKTAPSSPPPLIKPTIRVTHADGEPSHKESPLKSARRSPTPRMGHRETSERLLRSGKSRATNKSEDLSEISDVPKSPKPEKIKDEKLSKGIERSPRKNKKKENTDDRSLRPAIKENSAIPHAKSPVKRTSVKTKRPVSQNSDSDFDETPQKKKRKKIMERCSSEDEERPVVTPSSLTVSVSRKAPSLQEPEVEDTSTLMDSESWEERKKRTSPYKASKSGKTNGDVVVRGDEKPAVKDDKDRKMVVKEASNKESIAKEPSDKKLVAKEANDKKPVASEASDSDDNGSSDGHDSSDDNGPMETDDSSVCSPSALNDVLSKVESRASSSLSRATSPELAGHMTGKSGTDSPEYTVTLEGVKPDEEEDDLEQEDFLPEIDCTACGRSIHWASQYVHNHPRLQVLICQCCYIIMNSREFSLGETNEEYCSLCGDGGDIVLCDFCDKSFCHSCITRISGKDHLKHLLDDEAATFTCYICNGEPLREATKLFHKFSEHLERSKVPSIIWCFKRKHKSATTVNPKGTADKPESAGNCKEPDEKKDSIDSRKKKKKKDKSPLQSKNELTPAIIENDDTSFDGSQAGRKSPEVHTDDVMSDNNLSDEVARREKRKKYSKNRTRDQKEEDEGSNSKDDDKETNKEAADDSKKSKHKKKKRRKNLLVRSSSYVENTGSSSSSSNNSDNNSKSHGPTGSSASSSEDDSEKKNGEKGSSVESDEEVKKKKDSNVTKKKSRIASFTSGSSGSDSDEALQIEVSDHSDDNKDDVLDSADDGSMNSSRYWIAGDSDDSLDSLLISDIELVQNSKKQRDPLKKDSNVTKKKSRIAAFTSGSSGSDSDEALQIEVSDHSDDNKDDELDPADDGSVNSSGYSIAGDSDDSLDSLLTSDIELVQNSKKQRDPLKKDSNVTKKKSRIAAFTSGSSGSDSDEALQIEVSDHSDDNKDDELDPADDGSVNSSGYSIAGDSDDSLDSLLTSDIELVQNSKKQRDPLKTVTTSSDEEEKPEEEQEKKPSKKRRTRKRKLENSSKDSDSDDFVNELKGRSLRRRHHLKRLLSSDSDDEDDDADSDTDGDNEGDELNESQEDPKGKKRRKICKLIREAKLTCETKQPLQEEREKAERLKNRKPVAGEQQEDRLILEQDPETKEVKLEVRESLVPNFKPHQREGVKFLYDACVESMDRLANGRGTGAILAHCMGLGKTLQLISFVDALLNKELVNRVLILCPINTIYNWKSEFLKWISFRDMDYNLYLINEPNIQATLQKLRKWFMNGGVVFMGYKRFRNLSLCKRTKQAKQKEEMQKFLLDPGADLVVCDEGHVMRNSNSSTSISINRIKTRLRIVLTGTPLQNNLQEYYTMVNFVKPNLLGTPQEFKNRFVNPITNGQCRNSSAEDIRMMKHRAHVLYSLLKDVVQRKDFRILTKTLPPKLEYVLNVRLSPVQDALYRRYLDNERGSGGLKSTSLFSTFAALAKIWNHPWVLKMDEHRKQERAERMELYHGVSDDDEDNDDGDQTLGGFIMSDSDEDLFENSMKKKKNKPVTWYDDLLGENAEEKLEMSGKLVFLYELLEKTRPLMEKVLVFSQSLLTLDLIEEFLSRPEWGDYIRAVDYCRLDGSSAADTRTSNMTEFNKTDNDRLRLFLISTKAGSLGVNLVAANRVVIFDASWNPSHDLQAIFRTYRYGQKKPVFIYRLLAQVITRFPPEPNGYLHIGHAMAMNFSFRYAEIHGGLTYLRFDDTNPETTREECVRDIREMVEWLGFSPHEVTYASDYYQELYDFAMKLIHSGHAYVCHQKNLQGPVPTSPWRDRPTEESLQLFEDMRKGKFKEGEATLRMKLTLEDGKEDPVAYRIKATPHPRTGDLWCVYPMYDYAHCICDSLENITHSFCSKEFMAKRSSYYWLCNALNIYCPVQWEFSRLNISHAHLSKRKILALINDGIIKDWDDPRLLTLSALRRRGVPPEALRDYCDQYGVLQTEGEVDLSMIDHYIRKRLEITSKRAMVVVDPLKVTIQNYPWSEGYTVEVPNNKNDPSVGTRRVSLGPVIYLERSDFNEDCPKGYRRLTPRQPLGLKYAGISISLEEVIRDPTSGSVEELIVSCQHQQSSDKGVKGSRPKAYAHWVSDPIPCTMRFYKEMNSGEGKEGSVLRDSLVEVKSCLAEQSVKEFSLGETFQAERIGYFCKDQDCSLNELILNRTISLPSRTEWNIFSTDKTL